MATSISDSFTRGNSSLAGGGGWSATDSSLLISNNEVLNNTNAVRYGINLTALDSTDVESSMGYVSGLNSGTSIQLVTRKPTSAATSFATELFMLGGFTYSTTGPTTTALIQRHNADNTLTVLGSATVSAPVAGDVWRLKSVGTSHSLYRNDVLVVGPVTDATVTAGDYTGFRVNQSSLRADNFLANVISSNPPVANAGSDQNANPGATVTLNGSSSTGATSYLWSQTAGTTVTLSSTTVASPTFVAPSTVDEQLLSFNLTATNSAGNSTDSVIVNVGAVAHRVKLVGGVWAKRRRRFLRNGVWI